MEIRLAKPSLAKGEDADAFSDLSSMKINPGCRLEGCLGNPSVYSL